MMYTTLKRIKAHSPCTDSWRKLLKGLGKTKADDARLSYARILKICGLEDALWAARCEPRYDREWRLYAVWCARQVQHLMTDPRSIAALDVAERYANGTATDEELRAAWDAAGAAAGDAAWDAAWAARAAAGAARAAAGGARAAAGDAAGDAGAAAWDAARAAQRARFLAMVRA